MKNFQILKYSIALGGIIFFSSCTNNQVNEEKSISNVAEAELVSIVKGDVEEKKEEVKFKNVSDVTKLHVHSLINHYETVKNALVQSDFTLTQNKIGALINEVVSFNNKKELNEEQGAFYLKVGAKLKNNAERIQKSKDISEQREHFSAVTTDLVKIVKAFGGNQQELYFQYCPMAFDNNGGAWLSLNKEIRNPYFGDKMLKCGMVKETIK